MIRIVSNIDIYCSSDKLSTVYPVQLIFENFTFNINVFCNSPEDIGCCSSVHLRTVLLCSEAVQSQKTFRTEHKSTYTILLLRIAYAVTSKNIDFFPLGHPVYHIINCSLLYSPLRRILHLVPLPERNRNIRCLANVDVCSSRDTISRKGM
jgi:hypothetical protein